MSGLPQLLALRADPPRAMTYADLHSVRGTPAAATAALQAAESGASWSETWRAFRSADRSRRCEASASEWRDYSRLCTAEAVAPTPVTLDKLAAWWAARVIGRGLKSSGLRSVTSRVLSHAALLDHPVPADVAEAIWDELSRFRTAFPCEVSSLAPPLGNSGDGHLDRAIAYASSRAGDSILFRCLHALLLTSQALFCRPTAILDGNFWLGHIAAIPRSEDGRGGLAFRLLLPKPTKMQADSRTDSFPIPTGPATRAILAWLDTLGLLAPGAPASSIVFPDIDPARDCTLDRPMTVRRSTELLRRYVFTPAGIPGGSSLTLRSIRSGASTDAVESDADDPGLLAQGGWKTPRGARTYIDRTIAALTERRRR